MATDGTKIIDGDRAHDTYWGIMDLYDSGVDFDLIESEFPLIPTNFTDDFDNEIYVTSRALALWEIGQMTYETMQYVKSVIDKGACVFEWSKHSDKEGKARQKELDKFWTKISVPNAKLRKRKKYRKITNLFLNPDDLLTFQLRDGRYGVVICTSIDQHRGQCSYILVPTTYVSPNKPTVSDLRGQQILGKQIDSGYDQQTTRELQPGIDRIWQLQRGNYFFGLVQLAVDHKSFAMMRDKFEKIGSLKIIDGPREWACLATRVTLKDLKQYLATLTNTQRSFN